MKAKAVLPAEHGEEEYHPKSADAMIVSPRDDIVMEDAAPDIPISDAEMCVGGMHFQCDLCLTKGKREAQKRCEERAMAIRRKRVQGLDRNRHKRSLNTIAENSLLIAESLTVNEMSVDQKDRFIIWSYDYELRTRSADSTSIDLGRIPEGGTAPKRKACSLYYSGTTEDNPEEKKTSGPKAIENPLVPCPGFYRCIIWRREEHAI